MPIRPSRPLRSQSSTLTLTLTLSALSSPVTFLPINTTLRCGSATVAAARINLPNFHALKGAVQPWVKTSLDPTRPVVFLDTDALVVDGLWLEEGTNVAGRSGEGGSLVNPTEVRIAHRLLEGLRLAGFSVGTGLGVLTPYRSQVAALKTALTRSRVSQSEVDNPEVSTVDKYQGRDKDCLIISFVRSSGPSGTLGELLRDWRRVNVALTRARHKLIIIASASTLTRIPVLHGLVGYSRDKGWLLALPADATAD